MQNQKGEIYSLNLAQCQKKYQTKQKKPERKKEGEHGKGEKKGKEKEKFLITIDKRRP